MEQTTLKKNIESEEIFSPKQKLIFLTLLFYGLPIYIYSIFPFTKRIYPDFTAFHSPIFSYLLYGKFQYNSLGIIFDVLMLYCIWLLFKPEINLNEERIYKIYTGMKKVFRGIFKNQLKKPFDISKEEKVSLLFYMVKVFWAPLMVFSALENYNSIISLWHKYSPWDLKPMSFINLYFPLFIAILFTLDTAIFSFGYLIESKKLKNVVKSVEPTTLGWISALACYGPFLDASIRIAGPIPNDFPNFGNLNINIIFGFIAIILFCIYVWASVALGFKASNLTNRGIVSKGPYKYVRHPAYASKNAAWLIAGIPLIKVLGLAMILNLIFWICVYFIRALTEERHLAQDPDYVEYMKRVRYMFIPGLF